MSMNSPTTTTTTGKSAESKGRAAAEDVQQHAGTAVDAAKLEAGEVANSAMDHARTVVDSTAEEMRTQGRQQTERLSSSLGNASQELRKMAEASDDSTISGVVRSLADTAQRAARRLDQGGPEGLMEDVRRMGRQHPARFLAVAAASGFLAARLVRSTDTQAVKQAVSGDSGGEISGTGQRELTGQVGPAVTGTVPTPGPAATGPVPRFPGA